VLRPTPSRLASAVLFLVALVVLGCSEAGAREAITLDFESTAVGELPTLLDGAHGWGRAGGVARRSGRQCPKWREDARPDEHR
jgi:hypothetical protein